MELEIGADAGCSVLNLSVRGAYAAHPESGWRWLQWAALQINTFRNKFGRELNRRKYCHSKENFYYVVIKKK